MQRFKLLEGRYKAVLRLNESFPSLSAIEAARGCVLLRAGTITEKKSLTTVSLIQPTGAIFDPVTGWDTQTVHRTQELPGTGCETARE